MLKWFNKKKKDNKGFTLVELVIVVAILAILVGLLAPQYTKYVEKSRQSADVDNMEEMIKAIQVALSDTDGTYTFRDTAENTTETITIINKGKDTTQGVTVEGTNDAVVEAALGDYLGDSYNQTYLKSTNWGSSGVKATYTITDGTLDVTYSPSEFATAIGGTATSGGSSESSTESTSGE